MAPWDESHGYRHAIAPRLENQAALHEMDGAAEQGMDAASDTVIAIQRLKSAMEHVFSANYTRESVLLEDDSGSRMPSFSTKKCQIRKRSLLRASALRTKCGCDHY